MQHVYCGSVTSRIRDHIGAYSTACQCGHYVPRKLFWRNSTQHVFQKLPHNSSTQLCLRKELGLCDRFARLPRRPVSWACRSAGAASPSLAVTACASTVLLSGLAPAWSWVREQQTAEGCRSCQALSGAWWCNFEAAGMSVLLDSRWVPVQIAIPTTVTALWFHQWHQDCPLAADLRCTQCKVNFEEKHPWRAQCSWISHSDGHNIVPQLVPACTTQYLKHSYKTCCGCAHVCCSCMHAVCRALHIACKCNLDVQAVLHFEKN